MYPRLLLISTGLATFLAGLLLFAPLARLAAWLPESSPLRAATWEGTLHEGRATLNSAGGVSVWHLHAQPLYLLTLGIGGHWALESVDAGAEGVVVLRPWGLSVHVASGKVAASRLAGLAGGDAFRAEEPLYLEDLALRARLGRGLTAAEGTLSWGPGLVHLRDRTQPVEVPALAGRLSTEDGAIHLRVGDAKAPDALLLEANLTLAERQLHVIVPGRAMRVLGLSTKFPDDKPAFEMKQSLR